MHCGRVAARVPRPQWCAQQQQPRPCRRRLVATAVCVVLCALLVACLAQAAAQEQQPPQQREQTATAHAPDTAPPRCHLGVHLAWSARVGGSVVATPRVVDLLHDGTRQLLVPTFSHYLEALRGDSGADVRGFPFLHPRLRTYASPLPLRVYDDARAAWLVALHSGVLVAFDADGRVRGVLRVPQLLVKKDWRTQTTTHDAALDQLAMLRATTATPAAATAAATATATLSAQQQQQQQHDATRQTTMTRADAAEQLDAVLRARRGDDGVDRAVLASRRKHGNHGDNNNNDDMLHGQAQRRDARTATPATRDTTTAAADDDDKDGAARAAQLPTREDTQATTTATAASAKGNNDEDDEGDDEDDDEAMRAVKVMRDHDDYMHRDDDDDDAPWGEALSVDRDGAVQRVGTEAHLSLEARASMALLFHPERYYSDTAATTATRKAAHRGADDADDEDVATEHDVFDAHTRRPRRGAGTRAATVADDVVALDAHVYTTPVLVDTGRDDAMDVVLHVSYSVDDDDDDANNTTTTTTTNDVARQTTATAVVVMDVVTGAVKWSRVLQLSSRGTSGGGGVDAYNDDEHRHNNNNDSRTTTHTPESSDGATNEETTTTTTTAPSSSSASSSPVVALSSPLVVDADGDGVAEVYVTTASGAVVGLSESGRLLPPWPRQPGGALAAAVAAEDITGSGQLHLCVGDMDGRVVCYTAAGDELWHRDVVGGVTTHVTFGDVDGDGVMDVVFGTTAGFVYALRGTDGAVLRHFPQRTHGPVLAPVLLVDLHARASSPSVQQQPPSPSSLPHTPLQRSRGLHLVVPAHDGRVYIMDGVSGCVDTIDVDERASTMVLADDVTGSGMTELVVTTLGGGVYVFATHTPFHPLKRWDSATKSLNGHTASESAVGVYMAHVPPRGLRHARGDTMLLHVVVHDARTSAATAAAAPQAPPPPQRWQGYHVVVRAGAHAVLWRGVLTRPGLHTLRLRVPPQRLYATLTVTMTLPSGQTYSDHVACRFHAHVLDTVKYSLLVPFLCVCAALMLVHRRHIRYAHDGDEDAIDAYRRA